MTGPTPNQGGSEAVSGLPRQCSHATPHLFPVLGECDECGHADPHLFLIGCKATVRVFEAPGSLAGVDWERSDPESCGCTTRVDD